MLYPNIRKVLFVVAEGRAKSVAMHSLTVKKYQE